MTQGRIIGRGGGEFPNGYWQTFRWMPHPELALHVRGYNVRDNDFSKLVKQPDQLDGAETQCPYVVVTDADAHHARALAAGAKIVHEIEDASYGGRGYSCRDLEGHLWSFGSYDPWA